MATWSSWTACNEYHTESRVRSVKRPARNGGKVCSDLKQSRDCQIDCTKLRTRWSSFTTCSDSGYRQRSRSILSGVPRQQALQCSSMEVIPCVVDCQISNWTAWGQCNRKTKVKSRTRLIDKWSKHGGLPCPVDLRQTKKCVLDCVVSNYSAW